MSEDYCTSYDVIWHTVDTFIALVWKKNEVAWSRFGEWQIKMAREYAMAVILRLREVVKRNF